MKILKKKKMLTTQQRYSKRIRRKRAKNDIVEYVMNYKASHPCVICGESRVACLDFHHVNRNSKEENISYMKHRGWGKAKIIQEISKCIVICSNCHRVIHANDDNYSELELKDDLPLFVPVSSTTSPSFTCDGFSENDVNSPMTVSKVEEISRIMNDYDKGENNGK